jgi:glucose/arabinose dehydrogenase
MEAIPDKLAGSTRALGASSWARLIEVSVQTAVVYAAVSFALYADGTLGVLPQALQRDARFNASETTTIYVYFLVFHVAAYLIARVYQRDALLSSARRVLVEAYFAMIATGFAISALFLTTPVPFSPNLYALIYFSLALVYLLVLAAVAASSSSSSRETLSAVRAVVVSRWTPLAALAATAPGILAASSLNGEINNFYNWLRVQANVSTSGGWALVQAFPDHAFEQPIYLQPIPEDPDGFVLLSRTGRLRSFSNGSNTLLLDLWPEIGSVDAEMGAFSFALHPEFAREESANRGFVYLWYSHFSEGELSLRLTRFDIGLPTIEARHASRLPLMALERSSNGMHNGGTVLFGPDDFLYLSMGDFFDYRNAQGADKTLAGGIVRIDVDRRGGSVSTPIKRTPEGSFTGNYYVPTDNPWYGHEGLFEEFWAIGLRNPFRMSIDDEGKLWVGDVGWHAWEEHNVVVKGDNGGWPFREGPETTIYAPPETVLGRLIEPIYAYPHTSVAAAALGGFVYQGSRYLELQGLYLFADNNDGTVMAFDPEVGGPYDRAVQLLTRASQFGEMGLTGIYRLNDGRIVVTSLGSKQRPNGEILELVSLSTDAVGTESEPVFSNISDAYEALCSRCHGLDGRGQPQLETAPAMKPRPDFTSEVWQRSVTDERIRKSIVEGGGAVGLSEEMPPFGTFFSQDDLELLVEMLRAFDP